MILFFKATYRRDSAASQGKGPVPADSAWTGRCFSAMKAVISTNLISSGSVPEGGEKPFVATDEVYGF
jgi:hypothetical protein